VTFREYAHRRALIAQRLNIAVAEVTIDQTLAYDAGEMEAAEACDWPRLPDESPKPLTSCVLSSGPYYVRDRGVS
jgi:hypothetical protein